MNGNRILRTALPGILGLLGALLPSGCSRQKSETPKGDATQVEVQAEAQALSPWTWHRLGGLLVVEGEVDAPTDLLLKGRYLNERRHAEFGPVRWEIYAPPPGEIAELRNGDGKVLARWDFNAPPVVGEPKPRATPQPTLTPTPKPTPVPTATPRPTPSSTPTPSPKSRPSPRPTATPRPTPTPKPGPTPKPRPTPRPTATPTAPSAPRPAVTPMQNPSLPMLPPASGKGWPGSGEGLNLLRGPKGQRQICLTFDGGSSCEVAEDVLDALKARNIRTTLFLTGAFIRRYPDLVRRIAREGHEIGNHTLNHPHLAPGMRRDAKWTKERFQQELLQADALLFQLLGRPMDPYWRAPYGEQTPELRQWAEELGYRHVGWSEGADTLDWATPKQRKLYRTGNAILDRLRDRIERKDGDGLIVLMHLGSERPVEDRPAKVLGPFIDQALQDGWRFVSIGAYLHGLGKPSWNPANRQSLVGQTSVPVRAAKNH